MDNQLILLGTKGGPAVRQGGAMPTSSALCLGEKTFVIDCGIGVTRSAVEAGINLLAIDAIFITHLHSDHLLELGPLIYTAWTTGLQRPIPIYGPRGIQAYWQNFLAAMDFDRRIRIEDEGRPEIAELVTFHVINDGWADSVGNTNVAALRVDHPPVTNCFALRFTDNNKCIVFSADTAYFPPLAEFATGADVLVHEAMLPDGIESIVRRTPGANRLRAHLIASHTMATDVGRIASDARIGTLVLNHLIPSDDPAFGAAQWQAEIAKSWTGPLVVGHDGLVLEF